MHLLAKFHQQEQSEPPQSGHHPWGTACRLHITHLTRLASDGGPVLAGFAVGAVGMVLGALAGCWLLREALGPLGSKLAACLCGSYVGGSVNFAALALALQVPAASLPGAMAADNLLMAVFLGALMAVPVQKTALAVSGGGAGAGSSAAGDVAMAAQVTGSVAAPPPPPPPVTAESLSLTLAAAAASCTAAHLLAEALDIIPLTLLLLAAVAASLATAAKWLRTAVMRGRGGGSGKVAAPPTGPVFAGAAQLGSCFMMLFFAVIGASAGSPSCLAGCGVLVPFLGLMVVVHWVVVLALGRWLLRLPLEALLLGSNACIGGPATAAVFLFLVAMAAAKGWTPLVQPAMLAGSLGYATGTAAGLAVARIIGAA
ncbi:hypothetical protein VOLCADRAFT_102761 [Volvox carteri f. nagariensis]|uniref:Uncharacterized protein n=1 Tax=Volvox carteri f. nagariensis TaxID=3068 RepID=D8THW9_VOLCA|nr:uncharacterized protein VOLCADRAFT_102761 [Volvox carteri f. nagariensis]EFJ52788.1 hypothetical protein VOLCADRAFT_102761 [Volvox carteri f. nagariensis]|eukprot:XP_002945793.1 hypothetical protein VOLCADRAFT_102761 [Volvox carteri f. nagariensis]